MVRLLLLLWLLLLLLLALRRLLLLLLRVEGVLLLRVGVHVRACKLAQLLRLSVLLLLLELGHLHLVLVRRDHNWRPAASRARHAPAHRCAQRPAHHHLMVGLAVVVVLVC